MHDGLRRRRARVVVVSSGASHPGERNWSRQRGAVTEPYLPVKARILSRSRNLETRAALAWKARTVSGNESVRVMRPTPWDAPESERWDDDDGGGERGGSRGEGEGSVAVVRKGSLKKQKEMRARRE